MTKRSELIRQAEEFNKKQAQRLPPDKPYDPSNMDCEKMPFGCWIVIALVIWAAFALIMSMFQRRTPV